MKNVNQWTRAGKDGKDVYCPHCKGALRFYHFSFSGVKCLHCKEEIQKYDLLIEKEDE